MFEVRNRWFVGLCLAAWVGGDSPPLTVSAVGDEPPLIAIADAPRGKAPNRGPRRRALVVGINTYERSGSETFSFAERGYRNLQGATSDALTFADLLVQKFGFPREDVVVLTDHAATRGAILADFEQRLIGDARAGDAVVFYFAGHGSQVSNPASPEADRLEESLVPVDASRGAPDLRDREIRRLLNRLLDRGVTPTVILDSCFSGSAARGLFTLASPRALRPSRIEVRDPEPHGPNPFTRGALLLAAAQGDEFAWETDLPLGDPQGQAHGAFSWALLRSLRDAAAGEPAEQTFLRAQARLHAELRRQSPVLEGDEAARHRPLFALATPPSSAPTPPARAVVAVERVDPNGLITLQGGWAHGLALGSRLTWRPDGQVAQELQVVEMLGIGRSKARRITAPPSMAGEDSNVQGASAATTASAATAASLPIPSGTLVEITGWAAPEGRTLRVWIPTWTGDPESLKRLAARLVAGAAARGATWVEDPTIDSPTHVLRLHEATAERIALGDRTIRLEPVGNADALLEDLPRGARLFVQFPVAAQTAATFGIGPDSPNDGIEVERDPDRAAVQLSGRFRAGALEYAWLRPDSSTSDELDALPTATPWRSETSAPLAARELLRQDLFHLRKLQGWLALESPASADFAYELVVFSSRGEELPRSRAQVRAGEHYRFALRKRPGLPLASLDRVVRRYVYVFTIDSQGNSRLIFGVEADANRLPFPSATDPAGVPPEEIPLGDSPLLQVVPPLGRDTYFLLTTDEPLATPWILHYEGFRPRGPQGLTPLEELLSLTGGTHRGSARVVTPVGWSIERRGFLSVEGTK